MKRIDRPTTVGGVGMMLHIAEFLLTQATEILIHITFAPTEAIPEPLHERAVKAYEFSLRALDAVTGTGETK